MSWWILRLARVRGCALVKLEMFDYTADQIAGCCDLFLAYWLDLSTVVTILHVVFYSGRVGMLSAVNSLFFIAPSKSRYETRLFYSSVDSIDWCNLVFNHLCKNLKFIKVPIFTASA